MSDFIWRRRNGRGRGPGNARTRNRSTSLSTPSFAREDTSRFHKIASEENRFKKSSQLVDEWRVNLSFFKKD
jgi:hypothetical protein